MNRASFWVAGACVALAMGLFARASESAVVTVLAGTLVGLVMYCGTCMLTILAQLGVLLLAPAPSRPQLTRTWFVGNTTEGACSRMVLLTGGVFLVLEEVATSRTLSATGLALLGVSALLAPAAKKLVETCLIPADAWCGKYVRRRFPPGSEYPALTALLAEVDGIKKSYQSRAMEMTCWLLAAVVVIQKVVDIMCASPHS